MSASSLPQPQQPQQPADEELRSLQFVGIRGVMQKQKMELERGEREIADAFADLTSLMGKAKTMVALVDTYSARLAKVKGSDTASVAGVEEEEESLQKFALSLGLSAPVTRKSHGSGSRYYTELARQLADVLIPSLPRYGGMITAPDAYCLFNRARGIHLVSPEDMVRACEMFASLHLPVKYVVFQSGVLAIQDASLSPTETATLVNKMFATRACVSAMDVAAQSGRSAVLCMELLLTLESSGDVCRDDTVHGLFFYPNRFLTG